MDWEKHKEYIRQREEFKQMLIDEQLQVLASETQEDDTVIGEIYIKDPPTFENRYQLKTLLGNAKLVEEYTVMGQGDNAVELIFAIDNMLIRVVYFACWGTPFSMIRECKVYRFSKDKSLDSLDWKKIKKALFCI